MAPPSIREGIGQSLPLHPPRVISRELKAFDLHGKRGGTVDLLRCDFYAFGEKLTNSFPPRNEMNELDNGIPIAEREIDSSGLLFRDQSLFKAFHGKSNNAAAGDCVHPVVIAEFISCNDHLCILDITIGSKCKDRFIIRSLSDIFDTINQRFGIPTAANRTCKTSPRAKAKLQEGVSIDLLGMVECILLPIPRWKRPRLVGQINRHHGSYTWENPSPLGQRMLRNFLLATFHNFPEGLFVGDSNLAITPDDKGF